MISDQCEPVFADCDIPGDHVVSRYHVSIARQAAEIHNQPVDVVDRRSRLAGHVMEARSSWSKESWQGEEDTRHVERGTQDMREDLSQRILK